MTRNASSDEKFGAQGRHAIPRVSALIASFNYGAYIAEAIESVLRQTYADWELVIVDDGSTDDTAQAVEAYLDDPRVRYLRQENCGQPCAKNAAVAASQGSLIAFLDADDAWRPSKLERQVALFDADADLGVAYTGRQFMDRHGIPGCVEHRVMVRGLVLGEALRRTIPPFSSAMVQRAVLDDVGGFNETLPLAIDYDLWLRVALHYRFDFVDEPLLLYRTGHASLSRRATERRRLVIDRILPEFLARKDVQELVDRRDVARAYADTYVNCAWDVRAQSWTRALAWCARAVWQTPEDSNLWRNALGCLAPAAVRRVVRRLKSKDSSCL